MIKLKDIKFKQKSCLSQSGISVDLGNTINLYVVLTRKCNAACKFCEFRGNCERVNPDIFMDTINKLYRYYCIGTIHFTGGEPTLELDILKELCLRIKKYDPLIKISVNTNGIYLDKLDSIDGLDNVALSRHGLTDNENYDIFGTMEIATDEKILAFNKKKLHLSCNMIKGHIDSEEKIYAYLEKYGGLGVYDFGFVNLMKINDYCNSHFIEFPDVTKCSNIRGYRNIENDECVCQCKNWMYSTKESKLVSLYNRHAIKSSNIAAYPVYENNMLKIGFSGDYIDIE